MLLLHSLAVSFVCLSARSLCARFLSSSCVAVLAVVLVVVPTLVLITQRIHTQQILYYYSLTSLVQRGHSDYAFQSSLC